MLTALLLFWHVFGISFGDSGTIPDESTIELKIGCCQRFFASNSQTYFVYLNPILGYL
jgi:hypothetical protein